MKTRNNRGERSRLRLFDRAFDKCARLRPGQDVNLSPDEERVLSDAIARRRKRMARAALAAAVAIYAAPAGATWSAATAVDTPLVDRSTVSTHTWTTVANSGTLDVSACDEVQVQFNPSTGDASTDATVEFRACDVSGQNAGSCLPIHWVQPGEGTYQKISVPKTFLLARAMTATAGGDTASVTAKCIEKAEEGDALVDADGALTGLTSLTVVGPIVGTSFSATGGVDEDYGVDLDQVTGTPTATSAGHIKLVNDDGEFVIDNTASVILDATTASPSVITLFEDVDAGTNKILLQGMTSAQDITSGTPAVTLTRLARSSRIADGSRGPVMGAVSNGGTFDTATELCALQFYGSNGITTSCIATTAKSYDPTTAVATWIACGDTVASGTYFETLCNVEY